MLAGQFFDKAETLAAFRVTMNGGAEIGQVLYFMIATNWPAVKKRPYELVTSSFSSETSRRRGPCGIRGCERGAGRVDKVAVRVHVKPVS